MSFSKTETCLCRLSQHRKPLGWRRVPCRPCTDRAPPCRGHSCPWEMIRGYRPSRSRASTPDLGCLQRTVREFRKYSIYRIFWLLYHVITWILRLISLSFNLLLKFLVLVSFWIFFLVPKTSFYMISTVWCFVAINPPESLPEVPWPSSTRSTLTRRSQRSGMPRRRSWSTISYD